MANTSLPNSSSTFKNCSIDGCTGKYSSRGMCDKHYKRWYRYGDVTTIKTRHPVGDPVSRFWARVAKRGDDQCWEWQGYIGSNRYGNFYLNGKTEKHHRVAFFFTHNVWPEPCCLHLCDNTKCCNPAHLKAGTHAQNMREAAERGRLPPVVGEANPRAKITTEQVLEIRKQLDLGNRVCDISRALQIHRGTIDQIKGGRQWTSVGGI